MGGMSNPEKGNLDAYDGLSPNRNGGLCPSVTVGRRTSLQMTATGSTVIFVRMHHQNRQKDSRIV